jgi:hypothetical protein
MLGAAVSFAMLPQSGKGNEGSVKSRQLVFSKVQLNVSRQHHQHRQHRQRLEDMSKCLPGHVKLPSGIFKPSCMLP